VVLDVTTPDVAATAFTISEGISRIDIPDGKSMWIRCPTGTADVTYSQFDGIIFDKTKCAFAYTDSVSVDVLVDNADITIGIDDSVADTITYVGFLHTVAAGIAGASTVDSAVLHLRLSTFIPGQLIRIYGVAESSSQFGTLTDYASLASGLTLTTEFVDITVGYSGEESVDIVDLLQELVSVSGWDATSPIQLWVAENTGTVTGEDYRLTIFNGWTKTAIFAVTS